MTTPIDREKLILFLLQMDVPGSPYSAAAQKILDEIMSGTFDGPEPDVKAEVMPPYYYSDAQEPRYKRAARKLVQLVQLSLPFIKPRHARLLRLWGDKK